MKLPYAGETKDFKLRDERNTTFPLSLQNNKNRRGEGRNRHTHTHTQKFRNRVSEQAADNGNPSNLISFFL